ncbi:unnamed protein product [Phytomonas sp. EM1]|nr:unnamed protein product [Phytomonas sp. EM1]|eukprot:CCW59766.1 unnamed protein product [Phytomonas sp. isolate EM1]
MPRLVQESPSVARKDKEYVFPTYSLRARGLSPPYCIVLLWERMLQSYFSFSQSGAPSFVIDGLEQYKWNQLCYSNFAIKDSLWCSGFNDKNGVEALIFHFYYLNEDFDTFSWIIAFCLIDRLQLMHYVHYSLRDVGVCESTNGNNDMFRLSTSYLIHTLFIMYSLASKCHLEYHVSLNFLSFSLPLPGIQRRRILRVSARFERYLLQSLNYNCYVSENQVNQLLDEFLTLSERKCIFESGTR